jgi:hypothetical protein
MRFKLTDPMIIKARVKGKFDRTREISALLDFNTKYTWILRLDAIHLGYVEANNRPEDYKSIAPNTTPEILSLRGMELSIMIDLVEVSIGNLKSKNVKAFILPYNVPLNLPIDLVLGRSFLKDYKLTIDPKAGYLSLT